MVVKQKAADSRLQTHREFAGGCLPPKRATLWGYASTFTQKTPGPGGLRSSRPGHDHAEKIHQG